MRRLDRATATRRLIGMLARKGYSGGLAAAWSARRSTRVGRTLDGLTPTRTTTTLLP